MSFGTRLLVLDTCEESRRGEFEVVGLVTSMEERCAEGTLLYVPSLRLSKSAAAKISAEATTRRSEEV